MKHTKDRGLYSFYPRNVNSSVKKIASKYSSYLVLGIAHSIFYIALREDLMHSSSRHVHHLSGERLDTSITEYSVPRVIKFWEKDIESASTTTKDGFFASNYHYPGKFCNLTDNFPFWNRWINRHWTDFFFTIFFLSFLKMKMKISIIFFFSIF